MQFVTVLLHSKYSVSGHRLHTSMHWPGGGMQLKVSTTTMCLHNLIQLSVVLMLLFECLTMGPSTKVQVTVSS